MRHTDSESKITLGEKGMGKSFGCYENGDDKTASNKNRQADRLSERKHQEKPLRRKETSRIISLESGEELDSFWEMTM